MTKGKRENPVMDATALHRGGHHDCRAGRLAPPMGVLPTEGVARHGDARRLPLPSDTVTLTVTSPPYWDVIDYARYCEDLSLDWKRRPEVASPYEAYLDDMARCFTEVLRVTRPGGTAAIVVGSVLCGGVLHPIPHDLSTRLRNLGWELREEIIWHKVAASSRRAGTLIRYPYPGNFRPNQVHETVLVLSKPGTAERPTEAVRAASRVTVDDIFKRDTANSVWHILPETPGRIDHPCPFPAELPHRLIQLYSYAGEFVLDPFAGLGQTGHAAAGLGRLFIGFDREPAFADLANERLRDPFRRGPQHIVRWEKCAPGDATGEAA